MKKMTNVTFKEIVLALATGDLTPEFDMEVFTAKLNTLTKVSGPSAKELEARQAKLDMITGVLTDTPMNATDIAEAILAKYDVDMTVNAVSANTRTLITDGLVVKQEATKKGERVTYTLA